LTDWVIPVDAEFADVHVGMRTAEIEQPAGVGGLELFHTAVLGMRPCRGAEPVELTWRRPVSATTGTAPVRLCALVTRWRTEGRSGVLSTALRLAGPDGAEVQDATVLWQVNDVVVGDADSAARVAWDFGSVPWGQHLATRLREDQEFAATTATFDGTIALRSGAHEVQFRVYRGQIIEVSRKSLTDFTFCVQASERTWVELLAAPRNDFLRRAVARQFSVRGNGFQYLRLHKALMIIIDRAREAAAEAHGA
jgi:hypothetical protein